MLAVAFSAGLVFGAYGALDLSWSSGPAQVQDSGSEAVAPPDLSWSSVQAGDLSWSIAAPKDTTA
ncbi:hypothetical protein F7R91_25900 [Streptomyces luteolifulvus]|uniref:Uncharacterized protein n=1 Tax=Streptomyces luteolifulvus TaxID=2615112 RepID=A0A6H9UWN6_9ACTN|nr:hypothetical protein F7R91_25900 [Streptomyces luteolifulvus]